MARAKQGTTQEHLRRRRAFWTHKVRVRRLLAFFAICAVLAGVAGWLNHKGIPQRTVFDVRQKIFKSTAADGLAIRNVLVQGRVNTDPDVLRGLINANPGDPILAFAPGEVRDLLERLPWVKEAHVERRLPDTIYIKLVERRPMALWQNQGKVRLIDEDGVSVTDSGLQQFSHLPLVVGDDAPAHARALLELLAANPDLMKKIDAASWVGDRRWDLALKGGVTVQLPPDDIGLALQRLSDAEKENPELDTHIAIIDLREPGRVTVRAKPGAVKEYKAGLVTKSDI